jgi:hypothetical protein
MDSSELASQIVERSIRNAPNSNFRLGGWEPAKAGIVIRAAIDVLIENGLLTGCLLCKNTNQEKEET